VAGEAGCAIQVRKRFEHGADVLSRLRDSGGLGLGLGGVGKFYVVGFVVRVQL